MKKHIDGQHMSRLTASITRIDQPGLRARDEILYLENLYGNAIRSQVK